MEQLYSQLAGLARRYGAKRLVLFGSREETVAKALASLMATFLIRRRS